MNGSDSENEDIVESLEEMQRINSEHFEKLYAYRHEIVALEETVGRLKTVTQIMRVRNAKLADTICEQCADYVVDLCDLSDECANALKRFAY